MGVRVRRVVSWHNVVAVCLPRVRIVLSHGLFTCLRRVLLVFFRHRFHSIFPTAHAMRC